jgi:ElaB/YqjD/DUF883 family membrane-anchored ribosome-binding protein
MNGETKERAKGVVTDLKRRVSKATESGIDTRQIQAFVQDYPLLSLAAVMAIGYALGRVMSRL